MFVYGGFFFILFLFYCADIFVETRAHFYKDIVIFY